MVGLEKNKEMRILFDNRKKNRIIRSNYLITSKIISKFSDCKISTFLPDAPTISF